MKAQFIRYFITGCSAVVLDVATLALLKSGFGIPAVRAVILNQLFLVAYVFLINKYWSFKATGPTHHQIIRFGVLCGFNYLIAVSWMWFFHDRLGLHYLLARVTNIACAVTWNFVLYKYWVYAAPKSVPQAENPVHNVPDLTP